MANDVGKLGPSPTQVEKQAADKKKAAVLISLLSGTVYSTLKSLCLPQSPGTKTFDELVALLEDYYKPEVSSVAATYLFNQCRQEHQEPVKDFVNRLKRAAVKCDFGTHNDRALRDQFLAGLLDSTTRREILAKPPSDITTFQAVTKIAVARETAQKAAAQITPATTATSSVNAVQRKKQARRSATRGSSSRNKCYNCGKEGHIARDEHCPAKGHRCRKCQKKNHLEEVCRSSKDKKSANCVTEDIDQDRDDFLAFTISSADVANISSEASCTVNVRINGAEVEALVDSGSSADVLGEDVLRRLRVEGMDARLEDCKTRLFAYGNTELQVIGKFPSAVVHGSKSVSTDIVVVAGKGRCLLGRSTAKGLGLLRTGPVEVNATTETADFASDMQDKFPDVFTGVGRLRDYQLQLHVDPAVRPVAQKPRRVPFALREKVSAKIKDLIEKDIIEEVPGPTTWASPIVVAPKPNGDVRLCVDMRVANTAIQRERLPIPTVDEALEDLNGSTVFTKLDFNWGFHQVELAESSRDITTFCTQDGLYRYKRLSFGVNAAPEKFQHIVRQVLADCEGTVNIADDIIVHGKDTAEHDRRLLKVLMRLQKRGLTLNAKKCKFRMPKVEFMGFLLSIHGIGPTAEKSRAVMEAQQPKSAAEVRSFLGLVGFNSRFIPNLATTAEPLRSLTRHDTPFVWTDKQETAFKTLKEQLASAPALAYFDKTAPTKVIADASPVGLGAVLLQEQDGIDRPVYYASRSLSPVERRYSQTEREALALVWACERFHLYLFGLPEFVLVTDHKALEVIYSPRSKPSARIERWVLRLQPYRFNVQFVSSAKNIADPLSRLLSPSNTSAPTEDEHAFMVAAHAVPSALHASDLEKASAADPELADVRRRLKVDDWTDAPTPYKFVRNELTYIGQLILRGTRIVVPSSMRKQVLDLAHEGHQGIVKMKARLHEKVWWPGIDKDVEAACRSCYGCQVVGPPAPRTPVKSTPFPTAPWSELAVDILGPLPSGESILVLVDYYSRFFEIDVIHSTTSRVVIRCLDSHFARHGVPDGLRSDNGPQFISTEFTGFLQELGIVHHRTTPLWPEANGEVERQNRSLLKAIRAAHAEGRNWRSELNKFLLAYRATPHSTTGVPPASSLFRRTIKTKLPAMSLGDDIIPNDRAIRDRVAERQQVSVDAAQSARRCAPSDLSPGDAVLLKQPQKENKLSANFHADPFTIVDRMGDQAVIASPEGVTKKRHVSDLKLFHQPVPETSASTPETSSEDEEPRSTVILPPSGSTDSTELRRSTRLRQQPEHLKDYVC